MYDTEKTLNYGIIIYFIANRTNEKCKGQVLFLFPLWKIYFFSLPGIKFFLLLLYVVSVLFLTFVKTLTLSVSIIIIYPNNNITIMGVVLQTSEWSACRKQNIKNSKVKLVIVLKIPKLVKWFLELDVRKMTKVVSRLVCATVVGYHIYSFSHSYTVFVLTVCHMTTSKHTPNRI